MGTHVNLIHSICSNYSVISIIFVGMFLVQPNSGMNEVIKTPFSFLPELSFFGTLHWIKLLYRAAEECLLFTGTSMYLIVFGDIPCSASPGIF